MELLPLVNELLHEIRRTAVGDLHDQNFGMGMRLDEALRPYSSMMTLPFRNGYLRQWRNHEPTASGVSSVQSDGKSFKVSLDVQQFKPEELNVQIADNYIVVVGKHEEKTDEHGLISRQFTRKYKIPNDVNATAIVSKLSSDGVLSLEAPKNKPLDSAPREIPITFVNTAPSPVPEPRPAAEEENN